MLVGLYNYLETAIPSVLSSLDPELTSSIPLNTELSSHIFTEVNSALTYDALSPEEINGTTTSADDLNLQNNAETISKQPVYIAVGIIVGLVVILLVALLIRFFRRKSKPACALAVDATNKINATGGTNTNQQSAYDFADPTTNGEIVVNEIYISADNIEGNEMEESRRKEVEIYSKPMKKTKPEMVDNILYQSFDQ